VENGPKFLRRHFGRKDDVNSARNRPERAAKYREEILRLRAEGLSYHKIGERCGLSVGAVHRLVKLAAIQQPSPEKDAA